MAKSEGYVDADYLRKAAEITQHIKQRSYELLRLNAGDSVLDLGCGPGMDTIPLAKIVGDADRVVGIDIDEEMLQQADQFAQQEQVAHIVSHQQADVTKLPFSDECFDACRMERLLQVLPATIDPDQVITESLRVLKTGGRLLAVDTDWATASVHFDDVALERSLMQFFADQLRPNGYAGRQLFRLFRDNDLQQIEVESFPLQQFDFAMTPFGDWLAGEAIKSSVTTEEQTQQWLQTLRTQSEQGKFYGSVNMVMVVGTKS